MRPGSDAARAAGLLPMAPRDYLILFALADGPLHGHGLLKFLEAEAGGVPFDPANLYRSLRKLERDTFIVEAASPGADGPRRRYRLTPLGRAVLQAEASRLARLTAAARSKKLLGAR